MKFLKTVSPTTWFISMVIAVLFVCYLLPTFLVLPDMLVFNPISGDYPVGQDLRGTIEFAQSLRDTYAPYIGTNTYPPLASLIFVPFTYISATLAYQLVTLTTLSLFFIIAVLLQHLGGRSNYDRTIVVVLLVLTLGSYGMQFELERGQFNLITVALCCLALYLFHRTKFAWLAYGLIILAVNLKLYPLVFVPFFIHKSLFDRKDFLRLASLVLGSVALFWVLGHGVFISFIAAFQRVMDHPLIAIHNHSIVSFVGLFPSLPSATATILTALLALAFFITLLPLFLGWTSTDYWMRYPLALAGLLTCLVPSVSYDYKLSVLPLLFLPYLAVIYPRNRYQLICWLLAAATLVMTFFSYKNFQVLFPGMDWTGNKFILLMALFILVWVDALHYIYQHVPMSKLLKRTSHD